MTSTPPPDKNAYVLYGSARPNKKANGALILQQLSGKETSPTGTPQHAPRNVHHSWAFSQVDTKQESALLFER